MSTAAVTLFTRPTSTSAATQAAAMNAIARDTSLEAALGLTVAGTVPSNGSDAAGPFSQLIINYVFDGSHGPVTSAMMPGFLSSIWDSWYKQRLATPVFSSFTVTP